MGSLNRYNIIHKSHYNPWLVQGINHLKSELGLTVKGSYYDPDGTAIHNFPVGEFFGICPVPEFTIRHLKMIPSNKSNDRCLISTSLVEDVLQLCALPMVSVRRKKLSTYQYLADMQGTKYPVTSIHTKKEQDKFWEIYNELGLFSRAKPDFVEMAKEWCLRCNTVNEALGEDKFPTDYYKLPELLESFYNKSQNNDTYSNSTKTSKNVSKISAALVTVDPANRPDVVVNSPVPLSRLVNIPPRKSSNTARTPANIISNKRTHGLVVSPAPIRPQPTSLIQNNVPMVVKKKRKLGKLEKKCFRCEKFNFDNMYSYLDKQISKKCQFYSPSLSL